MDEDRKKTRSAVRRESAEDYLLISLISFGVTVIAVRVFLQLTGFPQIGNSVLHIAHALWGALAMFIAVLLPLAYANHWALQTSALLSGIGIGLFIDEVGKFITQSNDYFFPPALALIYGFFLIVVFIYLHFRRPDEKEPRTAMYQVFEGLQDAVDGDLDTAEAARIKTKLDIARQSEKSEIATLAEAINHYMKQEEGTFLPAKPDRWSKLSKSLDETGQKLGRKRHRNIISVLLVLWVISAVVYVAILASGVPSLDPEVVQWRGLLIVIQVVIGGLMIGAAIKWFTGNERSGLRFAILGSLVSLIALQTLYFYLSQFAALTNALFQLAFLLFMLAYRRWYLRQREEQEEQ